MFGWAITEEIKENRKWSGKKRIGEDIYQNREIEKIVSSFNKSGVVFRFLFFVKSSFLFRGKVEKKKGFWFGKKRVFDCFLVNNFGGFGRVCSCFF